MFLPHKRTIFKAILPLFFLLVGQSHAHDHHTATNPSGSLDVVIVLHIGAQLLVWCILFPIGLIYGFTRCCSLGQLRDHSIDPLLSQGTLACPFTGMNGSQFIETRL